MMQVMHGSDPTQGIVKGLAPKIFIFSGGNIGNSTLTNKKLLTMQGLTDAWSSVDGVTWYQINYQEGGDPSVLPLYSSQVSLRTRSLFHLHSPTFYSRKFR